MSDKAATIAAQTYDFCVIGGGIVGLATAMALQDRRPGASVIVLEKEGDLARHQTGHNSGVIHAGIYYQPNSLKARLCREGAEATKRFCTEHGIHFDVCGKLLVATNEAELSRMAGLEQRARENGIEFERLDQSELWGLEPEIAGLGALLVPATGVVDYAAVCRAMAALVEGRGGEIRLNAKVEAIAEGETGVTIAAGAIRIRADRLIACAGLQSDRIARLAGLDINHRIVPFRGEYYVLPPSKAKAIRHLIYPIPDPDLPFLGIHLTRTFDGGLTVGPNAVLGFAREGYRKGSVRLADIASIAGFGGFWRMASRNWRSGLAEFANSIFKTRYLAECRKYCPSLAPSDLVSPQAGIRAQAVMRDGTLVHDFLFEQTGRMLHVCNAPSPAATSAIPIGRMIVDRILGVEADQSKTADQGRTQ